MTLIERRGIHLPRTKGNGRGDIEEKQEREAQGDQTTPCQAAGEAVALFILPLDFISSHACFFDPATNSIVSC
jgi:hypothetical protein